MKPIIKAVLMLLFIQSCGLPNESAFYWEYGEGRHYVYQGKLGLDSKIQDYLSQDSTVYLYNTTDTVIKVIDVIGKSLTYEFNGKAKSIQHVKKIVKSSLNEVKQ